MKNFSREAFGESIQSKLIDVRSLAFGWDGGRSLATRPDAWDFAWDLARDYIPPPGVAKLRDSTIHGVRVERDGTITVWFENKVNARKLQFTICDGRMLHVERWITALSRVSNAISRLEVESFRIEPFVEVFEWLNEPLPAHRRMK